MADLSDIDFTDVLDKGNVVTSNAANVLHGLIDAGERGIDFFLDQLRPLAEQLDGLFGDTDNLVPAPPAGGVPTDLSLGEPIDAVAAVGVIDGANSSTEASPE